MQNRSPTDKPYRNSIDPMTLPSFSSIETVQRNWHWFLALGIIMVILGTFAVAAAGFTSLITILMLGWLLLIGGVLKLVYAFWARQWSGFFFALLGGVFYVVVGGLVLAKPLAALAALTLLIGALFVVSGIFKIVAAISTRFEHWGWVLFSGIISLLLGILVLSEWPAASLWVIGLFVGIDMIIFGWTWVMLSLAARQSTSLR